MTSRILASGMLRTARKLAEPVGAGRPAYSDLRRATSTAYYALFHQITRHGAISMTWAASEDDISEVARWFTHTGIRKAAGWVIAAGSPRAGHLIAKEARGPVNLLRQGAASVPAHLLTVAESFVELQDARHDADYSNSYDPVRFVTLDHLATADRAVKASWSLWRAREIERRHDEAGAYDRFLQLAILASGGPKAR